MLRGLIFLLASSVSCPEHVAVEKGNVVYTDSEGSVHLLTDSGRDSEPVLSPDGRVIAFVRAVREVEGVGVPRVVQSELWIVGTERFRNPKRISSGPAMTPDGRRSSAFTMPKFSTDNRYLYFLSDCCDIRGPLRLDLASGADSFLSSALEHSVLQSGRHRGSIIASIRTLSKPDSEGITYPIYPYFMLTRTAGFCRVSPRRSQGWKRWP
jgi:hypothetical protein